jgi:flagellar hook-associated protein 2
MAEYLSGQITFGGLTEDTDFTTLLEQLKTIEMRKANQLARWKADWQARIDAFQQVRTAMVTLQSTLTSMNSVDKFLVKGAESSQPAVAKATAGSASSPGVYALEVNQLATTSSQINRISSADKNTVVQSGGLGIFEYTYKGTTRKLDIPAGTTLEGLKNIINNDSQNPGVVVQLVSDPSNNEMIFQIRGKETGSAATLSVDTATTLTGLGTWDSPQYGQDAQIRFNGLPSSSGWLNVSSNTLTDVLDDGLTVNLYSTGATTITVALDSSAIRGKVEEFVEAVNAFRLTIQELTKFDENKTTYEPEYAESQSEMQKGSVLTGNYGVQMIASRLKSIVSAQALGFSYLQTSGGVTSGDIFSSLSQIGILTNAEQGSAMYGLLEINEVSGNEAMPGSLAFEEALERDPEGVALLFAAKGEGYSTASDKFGHVSHIEGITKPGLYDVEYTISGGTVSGTINGKSFQWSPAQGNQAGIYSSDPPPNDADGLVIEIYNLQDGYYTGTVGVRQGKVNELLSIMDGAQGFLGSEGTLAVLENNYKGIIDNIDKKLMEEDERLIKWERTIKARFSRLETQIANYQQLQASLESQIAQLSTKTSS